MPTVVSKSKFPARKAARPTTSRADKLRAVDKDGRLILGYAKGFVRVREGVDLTKPTLPPGKYFE